MAQSDTTHAVTSSVSGQALQPPFQPALSYEGPPSEEAVAARFGPSSGGAAGPLVKLDANENPYGASPLAMKAFAEQVVALHRYPDSGGTALRAALSDYTGFPASRIVLGNGSDELIDLICRVTLHPGDTILLCPPTFSVYALAGRASGAEIVEAPRDPASLATDLPHLLASVDRRTRLIFICSPNNPTGESLSEDNLRSVLGQGSLQGSLPAPLVVLDEAYTEFSGKSYLHLAGEYPNLVVLRTFSKAFGLAGLRVGYGIFPQWLADAMTSARLPYNVNAAAQAAALEALNDVEWMAQHVALMQGELVRLRSELLLMDGLYPLPSDANFLLVKVSCMEASDLHVALLARGISVRFFRQPDLKDYLRITIGTPEQNSMLLAALGSVTEGGRA